MPYPTTPLTDAELLDLLHDIVTAERKPLPGCAKQTWVIQQQIAKRRCSPAPDWIWLLEKLLAALIPTLIDYLKHKYGDEWPMKLAHSLKRKLLPWSKQDSP